MAFRGLFVGVDRYAAPNINWLSCARRDAVALDAVFADTLGDGGQLLTDEQATTEAIRDAIDALKSCDPDDTVVIFFSGHGAPSHHLITHDTDPADLEQTAIALDELSAHFAKIPAKRLLCVLDCCFSGGMGAKVLMPEVRSRDAVLNADAALAKMAGIGRVVFTASNATQPAWEHSRLGHGFLTYHLLEALVGGAPDGGSTLRLLQVLDQTTQAVVRSASTIGEDQHPTVRGTLEGDVTWPVFQRGRRYAAAFPDWAAATATPDLDSLESLGFPTPLIDAWQGSIPSLNELQLAAINEHHVLAGANVLVSAPTSSGKTMVGELAALKAAVERRRSIFLLPMKALVNDKYAAFTSTYAPVGVRTIRATGEIEDDIPDLLAGRFDICLMTNEKFAALALARPHVLDMVSLVVVDEAQLIADENRGVALEFLLTLLKTRSASGLMPQVVLLSAVIGAANGLNRWLDASLLVRTERPVPLQEGLLRANGDFRYIDETGIEQVEPSFVRPMYGRGTGRDWIIPLLKRLLDDDQQVIVFRPTRSEARSVARYLADALGLPPAQGAIDRLPLGDPSIASTDLRGVLARGVAFHISDLDREERAVVEEEFRSAGSGLRVIVSTTTLAMGVNSPASSVVIAGLQHPGQPPSPYSVAEYKNMVGRAGRLGFAEKGQSFVIAPSAMDEHTAWNRYVAGSPEDISSRFPVETGEPASIVTRVLASAEGRGEASGMTADQVMTFLDQSYAAFLRRQADPSWNLDLSRFQRALSDLATNDLVEAGPDGRYRLTDLGRIAGRSGTEVRSILRVVSALRRVGGDSINEATVVAAAQLTLELDEVRLPINRRSKDKEPNAWPFQLTRQGVPGGMIAALRMDTYDLSVATLRAKRAVACLMWMSDTPLTRIEQVLIQFGGGFDAAGPLRAVVSRSLDLLPAVMAVVEVMFPTAPILRRQSDLMTRLELGLPSALAPLGRLARGELSRPRYLGLARAGLSDLESLEAAEDAAILEAVSGDARSLRTIRATLGRRGAEVVDLEIPLYDA